MRFRLLVLWNLMSIRGSMAEKAYISCVPFIKYGPLTIQIKVVIFLNFISEETRLRIQS